jgi:hypothetical protein
MGMYMRRPVQPEIVEAEQVGAGSQNSTGGRAARPGEWVLTNHLTGVIRVMSNEDFQRDFVTLAIPSHLLASTPATPVAEPIAEPVAEPVPEPVPEPVAEPVAEPVMEQEPLPVVDIPVEPVAEPTPEAV